MCEVQPGLLGGQAAAVPLDEECINYASVPNKLERGLNEQYVVRLVEVIGSCGGI